MTTNHYFILCECGMPEHQIILEFESPANPDFNSLTIYANLNPLPVFTRLGNAIRYLLGKRSRYGDFAEVLVDPDRVVPMIDFLESYLREVEPKMELEK